MDEKIFVVPENEIAAFREMDHNAKNKIYEDVVWFFSHYKSKDDGKRWSKVHRIVDEWEATQLYKESVERRRKQNI
jgi:inorganic pyrophosphatase